MLDAATLQNKARAQAQALFDATMRGTVRLQPIDRETAWDGLLKRHLHVERLAAWHQFNEIRIEVDEQGRIVFFHDPRRFEGAFYRKMSDSEALAICATTGLIGKQVDAIGQTAAADEMLAVSVRQRHHRLPAAVQFLVNCSSEKVAALRVVRAAS